MTQRRLQNLTIWTAALAALSCAACGDDGSSSSLGSLSSATAADLMPSCTVAPVGTPGAPVLQSTPLVITPKQLNLWPPNHKFHTVSVADCISIAGVCDAGLTAEFIWGSSDEPVDSLGDGHFAPDILFDDCDRVQLRSERQGPKNGRVYKLGVRVVDGAGTATEASCTVIVDHDQRGVLGSDSGESYRVVPSAATGAVCDGRPEPVPVPKPPAPPVPPVDASVPPPNVIGI